MDWTAIQGAINFTDATTAISAAFVAIITLAIGVAGARKVKGVASRA